MDLLPIGQPQGMSKYHSDVGSRVSPSLVAFLGVPFERASSQLDLNTPVCPVDSSGHILNGPLLSAVG